MVNIVLKTLLLGIVVSITQEDNVVPQKHEHIFNTDEALQDRIVQIFKKLKEVI